MSQGLKFVGILGVALLGACANAQDTLQLVNNTSLVENVVVDGEAAGCGSYQGIFTPAGGSPVFIPQMFCVDLVDQVNWGQTWGTTEALVSNEAGWLADTYGSSVLSNATEAAGLQLAIWQVVSGGQAPINGGGGSLTVTDTSQSIIDDANSFLKFANGKSGAAVLFQSFDDNGVTGQSLIAPITGSTPQNNIPGAPAPAAIIPFALGLIGRMRKRNKA